MEIHSTADALFTKTQQKVLALLLGQPEQSFYLNEIVRHAGMGKGTVARELERLRAAGILLSRIQGNQNHYQANSACPVFPELKAIVQKTFGMQMVLQQALQPWWKQIQCAFIFGSVAKGTEKASSDIDIMLMGESLTYAEIMESLSAAEVQLGRRIQPTLYTSKEWQRRLKDKNAFVTRVAQQEKLWIKGTENNIG